MSRRQTALRAGLLGAALLGHVAAFVAFGFIPKGKRTTSVAIALAEAQKKREVEKEKKEPPKPKPPVKAPMKAPVAQKPVQAEPPPPPKAEPPPPAPSKVGDAPEAMVGFADLGLQMGGGTGGVGIPGGGGGAGGGGGGAPAKPAPSALPVVKQVKELAPVDSAPCSDDVVKPKMLSQVQPAYTAEAQQAGVEGKVKLEVIIDATGHVTSVRVLNGLGFGLDEAAIAAVKQWTFTAAQKCGSAVPTTIKMGVNFGLK